MFFLLLSLIPNLAQACETPIEGTTCAHYALLQAQHYEKAYFEEHGTFSDSFEAIDKDPVIGGCEQWVGALRVFNGGKEFLATYTDRNTGETWQINQDEEFASQTAEPRKP